MVHLVRAVADVDVKLFGGEVGYLPAQLGDVQHKVVIPHGFHFREESVSFRRVTIINYARRHLRARGHSDGARDGSNGVDIEVSRHHTVSVSNFQSIEVSTDDWMVHF